MAQSSGLLTNILNNLHTHLQTQTQLLPSLHAQLGLPPTALEDELSSLQRNLMDGVERQMDVRKKEVQSWLDKCELAEAECTRYSKALGGNTKATGTNISELRKELVLPRRNDTVMEYREKLRQLYHTKLDQLSRLTSMLVGYSGTLGADFFSEDVLEAKVAVSEDELDPSCHRDVTPERFARLEKELVRGKAEVGKRLVQLSDSFVQIDWLYTELGMEPPPIDTTTTGSSTLRTASPYDPFRVSTPTPESPLSVSPARSSTMEYQHIFLHFIVRVEEAANMELHETPVVPIGLENVEPTRDLMMWANRLRASLEDTKRRRETHIQAIYDQLEALWRRLGVDERSMDAFVEHHRGSTEDTVREYEEELERMMEMKRERMGVFVDNARAEILRLWDELMVGEEERGAFVPFVDDEYTEELLTLHEDEIKRLKDERRMKAHLLAGIKKYFEICAEETELAAAAHDQTRLLGRGPRDPGRLLREEKMRKRVSKEKPRLKQDLLASIPVWEEEAGRPFLVHGESIMQILMQTSSTADQENTHKRTGRAGSVPPRATTPVNHGGYAPAKGVVTPAVRTASSNWHSVPTKRMKMDTSNGSSTTAAVSRLPFGSRGANAARAPSPSKLPSKTSSSLPRPMGPTHIAMPIPKPGTQHHALGHGRVPTSGVFASYSGFSASGIRTASSAALLASSTSLTSSYSGARYPSSGHFTLAKKSTHARRESFKPRPSMDNIDLGVGSRWKGLGECVKEEEE